MRRWQWLLVLLSLFAPTARAAVAISEPVAELASSTNATSYSLGAFTPAADSLLVVFAAASGTVATDATVTGGGLTWTSRRQVGYGSPASRAYAFTAPVGSSPQSTTITFDCTSDAATGIVLAALQVTGANLWAPVAGQSIDLGGLTSSNPALSFASPVAAGSALMLFFATALNPPGGTPPGGWTETVDAGYTTPTAGAVLAHRTGGSGTGPVAYTIGTTNWAGIAIEVYEAGLSTDQYRDSMTDAMEQGLKWSAGRDARTMETVARLLSAYRQAGGPRDAAAVRRLLRVLTETTAGEPGRHERLHRLMAWGLNQTEATEESE